MDITMDHFKQELKSQIDMLDSRIATKEKDIAIDRRDRKRLKTAYDALAGAEKDRNTIKKDILIKLFRQILEDNESLEQRDLDGLAQAKAKEMGYVLTAYGPCKKAALNSGYFIVGSNGHVSLRDAHGGLQAS